MGQQLTATCNQRWLPFSSGVCGHLDIALSVPFVRTKLDTVRCARKCEPNWIDGENLSVAACRKCIHRLGWIARAG